jgi:hypothetical protein
MFIDPYKVKIVLSRAEGTGVTSYHIAMVERLLYLICPIIVATTIGSCPGCIRSLTERDSHVHKEGN